MRVGIDARYLRANHRGVSPEGGIGRYLHNLLVEMFQLAPEIEWTLFVPAANTRPLFPDMPPERVRERPVSAPVHTLRTLLGFHRIANSAELDLLHCPSNVLPLGLRVPAVTTVHDMMWIDAPQLCASAAWKRLVTGSYYRVGISAALERSAHVLTVSAASRHAILAHAPTLASRITVTHNGLDPQFRPLPDDEAWPRLRRIFADPAPFVLMVGQGAPYKNHAAGIRAFAEAFRHHPEVRLALVRRLSRHDADVSAALSDSSLQGRVLLLPEVSEEELRGLYAAACVFLHPSVCEGFGIPLLEAMAAGAPCVAANFGAMAEVGGDGVLQVDTRDVGALASGLARLYQDAGLRARIRAQGMARAHTFSWRNAALGTLSAYRAALAHGGSHEAA